LLGPPTIGHAAAPPSPAINSRRRIHPSRSSEGRLAPIQLSGSALKRHQGDPVSSA
jgi:hypothetical protein